MSRCYICFPIEISQTIKALVEGYRNSLDKKRQEVFEVDGMREETLVNHPDHNEAMLMNILVEMETRLQKLETCE